MDPIDPAADRNNRKPVGKLAFFLSFLLQTGLILILASSCKSSKTVYDLSTVAKTDSTELISKEGEPVDSITYFITSKGDTLKHLNEEWDLTTSKVRRDSISFAAVGDIMMGTNFPNGSYLPGNNGLDLWKATSGILLNADVTFGNLEGVILTQGGDQKECRNPKNCYLFRTPDSLSYHFADNGFDLLSLANNHANDFGLPGRLNTQYVLDSLGIVHAGSEERPFGILKRKGFTVGFVAFAPNKGTINIHDEQRATEMVRELDLITDIVVVSFHAGAEGAKNQHVPRKREFYFGEDRGNVYEFAHLLVDAGADLIFGHGPHVVRAIELYQNRLIAYSLGNFLTYGRFNLRGPNAYAPVLRVNVDRNGKFISGRIDSFIQDYTYGPVADTKLRALKRIRELSEADFPDSPVRIEETGLIRQQGH